MSIKIRSFQGSFKGHFNIIFIDIGSMINMAYSNGLSEFDEIAIKPRTEFSIGYKRFFKIYIVSYVIKRKTVKHVIEHLLN